MPDAYLVLVDHGETARQVSVLQKRDGSPNRLTDSLFRRWMNFQPHHAGCMFGWKANYVREVGIKGDKYATFLNRVGPDLFVWGSRQPNFRNSTGVVTVGS